MENEYNWAGYKRRERGHRAGNHTECDYDRCEVAQEVWTTQERRCDAKALIAELASRKINARKLLARAFKHIAADAKACATDIDFVHQLHARCQVDDLATPEYRAMLEAE